MRRGTICRRGIRPYQTCHRRFQRWQRTGVLERVLQRLAEDLRDRGKLDLARPSSTPASARRKRGSAVGPTRRGKGSKIMAIGDRHGLPLAVHVASASPHEVTLVDATLAAVSQPAPQRLIGDRGYDSDRLDTAPARDLRDRDDREASPASSRPHPRRPTPSPRAAPLEDRTTTCLVPQLPSHRHALGTSPGQFPRDDPSRVRRDPPEGIYEIGSSLTRGASPLGPPLHARLAGTPTPRSARVAHSLRSFAPSMRWQDPTSRIGPANYARRRLGPASLRPASCKPRTASRQPDASRPRRPPSRERRSPEPRAPSPEPRAPKG